MVFYLKTLTPWSITPELSPSMKYCGKWLLLFNSLFCWMDFSLIGALTSQVEVSWEPGLVYLDSPAPSPLVWHSSCIHHVLGIAHFTLSDVSAPIIRKVYMILDTHLRSMILDIHTQYIFFAIIQVVLLTVVKSRIKQGGLKVNSTCSTFLFFFFSMSLLLYTIRDINITEVVKDLVYTVVSQWSLRSFFIKSQWNMLYKKYLTYRTK